MFRVTLTIPGTGRGFSRNFTDPNDAAEYAFTFARGLAAKQMEPQYFLNKITACGTDIDALILAMDDLVGIEIYEVEGK